jgi:hypothetical protein
VKKKTFKKEIYFKTTELCHKLFLDFVILNQYSLEVTTSVPECHVNGM